MKKIYVIDGEKIRVCGVLKKFKKDKEEYVQIKLNGNLINIKVSDIPTSDKFKTDRKDAIIEMYKKIIKYYKEVIKKHIRFLDRITEEGTKNDER